MVSKSKGSEVKLFRLIFLLSLALAFLLFMAWMVMQVRNSVVFRSSERFYMVASNSKSQVVFASFDPSEKKVVLMEIPEDLYIKSRSVGEYKVGSLYSLGDLEGEGGEFVERKIQGFLRTPILGYVVVSSGEQKDLKSLVMQGLLRGLFSASHSKSNLTKLDTMTLLSRLSSYNSSVIETEELVRSGVLVEREGGGYTYNHDRLMVFTKERFFDWSIGDEGLTVSVSNRSGLKGLGGDVVEFLITVGADVVMVKDEEGHEEEGSRLLVANNVVKASKTVRFLEKIFGVESEVAETAEYRADVVLFVGTDMLKMF